jgi:DNA polymerase III delta subunit
VDRSSPQGCARGVGRIATFLQWHKRHADGELKRAYYLYGPDRVLVEEVVDAVRDAVAPSDLDRLTFSAGSDKDIDVWTAVNQYPLEGRAKKLVVVREAEKMKDWSTFETWLMSRSMPNTHVVFVSDEETVDTSQPHIERIKKTGRLVKCGPLNEEDTVTYLQLHGSIDRHTAMYLVERVGGKLWAAAECMKKAAFFNTEVTVPIIDAISIPSPGVEFTDELLAIRKRSALAVVESVPLEDYPHIVGRLDYDLEILAKIHRAARYDATVPGVIKSTKVPGNLVKKFLPSARYYDRDRVRECVRTLNFVDARVQRGVREGVLEVLVALW